MMLDIDWIWLIFTIDIKSRTKKTYKKIDKQRKIQWFPARLCGGSVMSPVSRSNVSWDYDIWYVWEYGNIIINISHILYHIWCIWYIQTWESND